MTVTMRGLSPGWVLGLAALALPRAVLHDLGTPAQELNLVLTVGPPIAWVIAVTARRTSRPFVDLLLVGLAYGVALALLHQLTWTSVWDDTPPAFGDNLRDLLPSGVERAIVRGLAAVSSIAAGLVVGAVSGAVAGAVARLRRTRG